MAKQKTLSGEFEQDMARYRKASEPHKSPEEAQTALDAFCKEVGELRVKYQVRDLYAICSASLLEEDGSESAASTTFGFGTQSMWLPMIAAAYGIEKQKNDAMIRTLLANGAKEK